MLQHRGFPTTTTDRTICALSLAPSRTPLAGASESAYTTGHIQHRAPTRPERAASAFPVRRDATTSVAVGFAEVRRTRTGEALASRAHTL